MRQPSFGPLSHKDELTMVPAVETREASRKHAVRRSGLLTVEDTISVVLGIEPEIEGVGGVGLADMKVKFG